MAFFAAAFAAAVGFFAAGAGFFAPAAAGFFATAAGFFGPPVVAFFARAAAVFFVPRALPGVGADASRAPAFFLLLAIGGQYTTRRPRATRARPAVRPAAGPAAGAPGS